MRVYLDTSIISFLIADDAPEYKRVTEAFFADVLQAGKIEPYISTIVIQEINNTTDDAKREDLLGYLKIYPAIQILTATDETADDIAFLAKEYIDHEIIPQNKVADAFHIAFTTVYKMDILLSWNFKHLANVNKEQKILALNRTHGFNYSFRMANPLEVFDD